MKQSYHYLSVLLILLLLRRYDGERMEVMLERIVRLQDKRYCLFIVE